MKKIGLLAIAALMAQVVAAQTTVDVYATGAIGSLVTGNATSSAITDNVIVATNAGTGTKGWAVFDLSSIPHAATITGVELHFNTASVVGFGPGGSDTRGYDGDISLITSAATMYTTMGLPSLSPVIYSSTSPYGGTGNHAFPTETTAEDWVTRNLGGKASAIWSTSAFRVYTITGETGAATTTGAHAPFLRISYNCTYVTSVLASAPATTPCANEPFTLSGSAAGEIASLVWTGPFGFSSTLTDPTVSGGLPSPGVYTLTATDTSGCSATSTVMVTVNPLPSSTISPVTVTAFCSGGSALLDGTSAPGSTYQWYDNGVVIAGATDATYTSTTTGSYKVEVTDVNGCIGTTPIATPTVMLDTPDVSPVGPVLLCQGDNGTLVVNTNGVTSGVTFQWQRDGVDLPGEVSNSHIAAVSGVFHCNVAVPSSGCSVVSRDVSVVVNDYPTPVVSFGGGVLSTFATYAYYQWFVNTVAIPGATNSTYVPSTNGSYQVRVKDSNGCTAYSTAYPVNTTGVSVMNPAAIQVFPNPAVTELHIAAPMAVNAVLSSVDCRVVQQVENATAIDISSLAPGLYLLSLYDESGARVMLEKIAKQ